MRAATLAAAAVALCAVAPADGAPKQAAVNVQYSAYGPSQLDVLPGVAVTWSNVSARTHTVTADDGSFDSGHLGPQARFRVIFSKPGTYRYHCTIHPSIAGEVDVRRLTLGTLPTAVVPVGTTVDFSGLTVDAGKTIRVERRMHGSVFAAVAHARAATSGAWHVRVAATATGDYRAASGTDASEVRRLLVGVRKVLVRPAAGGVEVEVAPSAPYATILVQRYERERFGWWPVARRRLDYVSEARLRLRGPGRVRVVLVDRDGWTPLATSRVVTLGR